MFDGESFGAEVVAAVKGFLDQEVAPMKAEIASLRAKLAEQDGRAPEKGERGEPGAPGEPGRDGVDGRDGKDGESVTLEQLEPLITSAVERAVAAIPIPVNGRDGLDGKDGARGADGLDGKDGAPGEKGEPGKDGVGLAGALIDRSGSLVVTLTDGTTRELGAVVGKDGADGRDGLDGKDGAAGPAGLGFDDLDVVLANDGRTVVLSLARGEQRRTWEIPLPVVLDRGVFKAGEAYAKGDGVTWGGSWWIAQRDTSDRPGEGSDGWRLAVKKGRDGKDVDVAGAEAKIAKTLADRFEQADAQTIKRVEAYLKSRGL